jgi:hypothetical protein
MIMIVTSRLQPMSVMSFFTPTSGSGWLETVILPLCLRSALVAADVKVGKEWTAEVL